MEARVAAGWKVIGVLGGAWGSSDKDAMGSEHLLAGITGTKGEARTALDAESVTKAAVLAVLRDRADWPEAWSGDDGAGDSISSADVLGEDGDRRRMLTGAGHRAFVHAMGEARRRTASAAGKGVGSGSGSGSGSAKLTPEDLLRGLLAEGDNRCAEVLALCGTTGDAVLARLDAGPEGAADGDRLPAGLDPRLRPTRDVLLGRSRYPAPFWLRWLHGGMNWVAWPTAWVKQETLAQARLLGHDRAGTEHVLLAVLATHEVARAHPHMLSEGTDEGASQRDERYLGGERLAAVGITYAGVRRALEADDVLGGDDRPAASYVDAAVDDQGTGPLVESLLKEGTRALRLVQRMQGAASP
ncbi:Clp protease N-terminal domain-containing protein [Streptomyces sp. NPDC048057]|uniref:Clp protease N-terminal domain-containing protein n=1 Tax=Streptomyces sp. NPDC048057 TaxID=3155628 RepID=UPI0033F3FB40